MLFGRGQAFGESPSIEAIPPMVTNTLQLRRIVSREDFLLCPVRLEGIVVWVSPTRDQLILQDNSGRINLNLDLKNQPDLKPGQRVQLEANFLVGRGQVKSGVLVDNDGLHSILEESSTAFLRRGRWPIRVEWFNHLGFFTLDVEWMGPGLPRQTIANASLFRATTNLMDGTCQWAAGLDYRCYEGIWQQLPDFSTLPVKKQGVISHFDISGRTRPDNVAILFNGYIEVPADGLYTFWTKSDDGSKLFIGDSAIRLDILGTAPLPPEPMVHIIPSQSVFEAQGYQTAEVEGTVSFVNEQDDLVFLDLNSSTGRTELEIEGSGTGFLKYLTGCRVRATGIIQAPLPFTPRLEFSLLLRDPQQIAILEMPPEMWAGYPLIPISSLVTNRVLEKPHALIHISGISRTNSTGQSLLIEDQTGRILIKTSQPLPRAGEMIEALGWLDQSSSNPVLACACYRITIHETNGSPGVLPLLTQAVQVKRLNQTEAQRGYPAKIRGLITARIGGGYAMQDSTWSIFIRLDNSVTTKLPKIGEYWQIEGKTSKTSMDFAPSIIVAQANYLGTGILPEPLRPTWDELINGSLDTQYIEVQGIVTSVGTNSLMLLTRDGKISVELSDLPPQEITGLVGALICARGVNSPERDENLQMLVARLRLFNASINVYAPAPARPFDTAQKHVSDLTHFDFRANALQRVRIDGQLIHENHGEYFLLEGTRGLRFRLMSPVKLQYGDLVSVVGFPDLSNPSLTLRESLVLQTGKAPLPEPRQLTEDIMYSRRLDATLVSIAARVVGTSEDHSEQVFELQAGNHGFVARLEKEDDTRSDIPLGSQLELTGVYAGQGGNLALNQNFDSFELLLNSPADIRVLARPSWWTVRHTLTVLSGMVFLILCALIWIAMLHRQVEERSRHLAVEIQRREQLEYQRALQEERSRIARDLHDDLGATLTQIRFLSAVKSSDSSVPESTREELQQVSEKSRQMVSSLDEIVWAVNPANDSIPKLASYLRHAAAEFFGTTNLNCRFDVDRSLPDLPLTSEMRHNLYLTVREALNNCLKHSQATELWLRIHWREQALQITIEDNGCGISDLEGIAEGNGLVNMRVRMGKIGGSFAYNAHPDSGTICRITLPVKKTTYDD